MLYQGVSLFSLGSVFSLSRAWSNKLYFRAGSFPQEIQADINALKDELRLSDTDTIGNWKAFLAATMDKNLVIREDKIKFAFDHFKHSDTDYLTIDDFVAIFQSAAQAKEIFEFLDSDCDGKVSFTDFRNAMEEYIDIDQQE